MIAGVLYSRRARCHDEIPMEYSNVLLGENTNNWNDVRWTTIKQEWLENKQIVIKETILTISSTPIKTLQMPWNSSGKE
jgi:hypothetical protein